MAKLQKILLYLHMEENVFKFKQFSVCHGRSSMKVGVDAVLLGAWAGDNPSNILDVGTGCGVISLMLAQRFPFSNIMGIDIDESSVEEANKNFYKSPWKDRLSASILKFPDEIMDLNQKFDLIISNPPYFRSGIYHPGSQREVARHQDTLSLFSLLEHASSLLTPNGKLAIIFPIEFNEEASHESIKYGLTPSRICFIRDNETRKEKRVMMEFSLIKNFKGKTTEERIALFNKCENKRKPTDYYRNLCKDFYLKF